MTNFLKNSFCDHSLTRENFEQTTGTVLKMTCRKSIWKFYFSLLQFYDHHEKKMIHSTKEGKSILQCSYSKNAKYLGVENVKFDTGGNRLIKVHGCMYMVQSMKCTSMNGDWLSDANNIISEVI